MTPALDIGIAEFTAPGQELSGDRCVVKTTAAGLTLIGVIDGVGHGPEAAQVAAAAAEELETAANQSIGELLRRCHDRLRGTRGAAITLVAIDPTAGDLAWVGTGSVAAALRRTEPTGKAFWRELLIRGGIVGGSMQSTEALHLAIGDGDTLVLATDGVRRGFVDGVGTDEAAQRLAERLLARYGTTQDDALIVVARLKASAA